jgi:hypothetical protein
MPQGDVFYRGFFIALPTAKLKKSYTILSLVWKTSSNEKKRYWRDNGLEGGEIRKREFLSFPELEEMRTKVPDLVEHPALYRIDLKEHKIFLSQSGRSTN